jgi:GDP-mannose 4,6-dehydratase
MKVLITGITGFVGSHLAEYCLAKKDVEVYGIKRWRSPMDNIKNIADRVDLRECDLLDESSVTRVVQDIKPDWIFHLAAQSYVPASFDVPRSTLEVNIIGTLNLLEAVRKAGIDPRIHICSSSEVYGQVEPEEVPITEKNPLRPQSPYAVSKVGEDLLGYQYFCSYGLKTYRTRAFTHTGPRRGQVFVVSAFAKQVAQIEKKLQSPVLKVGNLESVRTFLDVRDIVHAYWLLLEKCAPGEVYNIGGNTTMKIDDMLKLLLTFSPMKDKIKVQVDPALLRPSDVTLQIPSVEKFKKATGWTPKIPFEKTLEDTLNYWRERV